MIQLLRVVALLLAVSSLSAMGCQVAPLLPVEETFQVQFDSRSWITVFQDKEGEDAIVQYVPQGSSADSWTEMITTRSFPGLQQTSTPVQAMTEARKLAEDQCSKVHWMVIGQEPGSVRYAATFGGCNEARAPHEVGRFIMSAYAMYLVKYQTKKETFSAEEATQWGDILSNASYDNRLVD